MQEMRTPPFIRSTVGSFSVKNIHNQQKKREQEWIGLLLDKKMRITFLIIYIILSCFFVKIRTLIVEGTLQSEKDWTFLTRFCYQTRSGRVDYWFEFPSDHFSLDLVLYYDGQWPDVYPNENMACQEKLDRTKKENHQILTLRARNPVYGSGCRLDSAGEFIICEGTEPLKSVIPRWWYLALARCSYKDGINLKYRMVLTNGDSFWSKHFSADEKNILETDIFFLVVMFFVMVLSLIVAYQLNCRQLLHTTYKLYLWSVLFEVFSIAVNIGYYTDYGNSGKPSIGIKNISRGCHCIYDVIFVVLLILLGKGWTVTRGRISAAGQVKLSLFCTFYAIAYVALFIYEAKVFDPALVLYIYESPAGVGICVLRVIAWVWFCYGVFFTLKNYSEKRLFYYPFWMFYTLWFLSGPIVVMIATYMMEAYIRAQVVNGVERSVAFVSSLFFLIITRPSAANKNFPYHVRTSQIGIIDDSDSNHNFEQRSYDPSPDTMASGRNLTALFSASHNSNVYFNGLHEDSSTDEVGFTNLAYNDDYFRHLKPSNQYNKNLMNTTTIPNGSPNYQAVNRMSHSPSPQITNNNNTMLPLYNQMTSNGVPTQHIPMQELSKQHIPMQELSKQATPPMTSSTLDENQPITHPSIKGTSVLYRTEESLTSLFRAGSATPTAKADEKIDAPMEEKHEQINDIETQNESVQNSTESITKEIKDVANKNDSIVKSPVKTNGKTVDANTDILDKLPTVTGKRKSSLQPLKTKSGKLPPLRKTSLPPLNEK